MSDRRDVDSGVCPRCGAAREPEQEYCVDCGLRLPPTHGAVPSLRRRWVDRLGWYPGDWVWNPLLALVIAVVGTAAAIWLPGRSAGNTGTTFVQTSPSLTVTTFSSTTTAGTIDTTTLPEPPEPTTSTPTPRPAAPANGKTEWPEGKSGWTVVLVSYPIATGRDAALQKAQDAAKKGLPEVGVLVSSRYSSLHPGYYVVFSGVYDSKELAQGGRRTARSNGFAGAYERPITR